MKIHIDERSQYALDHLLDAYCEAKRQRFIEGAIEAATQHLNYHSCDTETSRILIDEPQSKESFL